MAARKKQKREGYILLNRIILMGRITTDLYLKVTPAGVEVCTFGLAVERNYQQNGQRQTDFFNIVAWRGTAKFACDYFKKGQLVALDGTMQTRSYEDKQGQKRTVYEVVAENLYFTGAKKEEASASAPNNPPAQTEKQSESGFNYADFEQLDFENDGDLPF